MAVDAEQVRLRDALLDASRSQHVGRPPGIGQMPGPVDEKQWPAVDPDVPGVGELRQKPERVRFVVCRRMLLRHENIPLFAEPAS